MGFINKLYLWKFLIIAYFVTGQNIQYQTPKYCCMISLQETDELGKIEKTVPASNHQLDH